MDNNAFNRIGEFTDTELENEFFQQDMQKEMRYIKPIILILGVFNTLFLIPDYFLVRDIEAFDLITISRLVFLLLIVIFYFRIDRMKDYRILANWLTAFEAIAVLTFLYVFYQYKSPDFLIQGFGIMVILLVIFMIPNRWVNILISTFSISTVFILMSVYFIKNIKVSEFLAGIVYIIIFSVLCSIISFRIYYYKRVQYVSNRELVRLSMIDTLSGAYNRAKFDEEFKYWTGYSQRYDTPLSLTMLDFDNFKLINDTYGHLVGDSVIVECANLMKESIRENDIFARWGGEEFVIILPNTDREHAVELAERLRQKIDEYIFDKAGHITCSFGVAELSSGDKMETLLQKADHMLYEAKNAGKNAVRG